MTEEHIKLLNRIDRLEGLEFILAMLTGCAVVSTLCSGLLNQNGLVIFPRMYLWVSLLASHLGGGWFAWTKVTLSEARWKEWSLYIKGSR